MLFKSNPLPRASRRGCKRINLRVAFEVLGRDEQGFQFVNRAETVNLCGEGGCLILDKDVRIGEMLKLNSPNRPPVVVSVQWSMYDMKKNVRLVGFKLAQGRQGWLIRDATRGRQL